VRESKKLYLWICATCFNQITTYVSLTVGSSWNLDRSFKTHCSSVWLLGSLFQCLL